MFKKSTIPLAAILVAALAGPAGAVDEPPDPRPLSPAQIALFESDHMHGVEGRAALSYAFRHEEAGDAKDYADHVSLDVRPRSDGKKDVWIDFLTGDHHVPYPPAIDFRGNPVLMFFLERDVQEMHKLTGGAAAYFRNRIRDAFVDRATVRETTVETAGGQAPGTEITLLPFNKDPRLAVLPGWKDKSYRFVLSDKVPGTIYEIETEVPGANGEKPLLKETMIFAGEKPCGKDGPCGSASSH
jgi:hypothetical protein